jgi:hypothetical protein
MTESSRPCSASPLREGDDDGGGAQRVPCGALPILGDEGLPNRCGGPSVRAVNRWNLLRVQLRGDRLKGHPLSEHRVDLYPPPVVTSVAEPMCESDVVGCEMSSVHLESRVMVSRRLPIGTRRSRLEVPAAPEAVALGHLATHVDDLAISGKLPEDSANSQPLEPLKRSLTIHEGQTRGERCGHRDFSSRPDATKPSGEETRVVAAARSAGAECAGKRHAPAPQGARARR